MAGTNHKALCQSSSSASSIPVTFSYPPALRAYVIRRNHAQAAQRSWRTCNTRKVVGLLMCTLVMAFLLIGSLWLLFNFYAPEHVNIGKYASRVYTANSFFVKRITATSRLQGGGTVVYGLSGLPDLDRELKWTEEHDAIIPSGSHQEWFFWLNVGSQVRIEYNISDPTQQLYFVVLYGEGQMQKWTQNLGAVDIPSYWEIVQGIGNVEYEVTSNEKYYFGLGNTQVETAQVKINFSFCSKVHNTDQYKSKCTSTTCSVELNFLGSDVLLLTTAESSQSLQNIVRSYNTRYLQGDVDDWLMDISFEQRWFTYLCFWGAMAVVMLILLIFCRPSGEDIEAPRGRLETADSESSSPIVIIEEDEKNAKSEQYETSSLFSADFDVDDIEGLEDYICIICFEQRRNCFFDPCGHCATCYSCSMKILKDKKAQCPLCRQSVRLVRKLILN